MTVSLSSTMPVANKIHKCSWCGEIIQKGEKYHRWTCIFEHNFQSNAAHLECYAALESLDPFEQEEGFDLYQMKRGETEPKC